VQIERLLADTNFNPDVGFCGAPRFRRDSAYLRFQSRPPRSPRWKFTWDGAFDYITDPAGRLESRLGQTGYRTEFNNGDVVGAEVASIYERIDTPFLLGSDVYVPAGEYSWPELHVGYSFGPQRRASGSVNLEAGNFYDGTRTSINTGRGRMEITPAVGRAQRHDQLDRRLDRLVHEHASHGPDDLRCHAAHVGRSALSVRSGIALLSTNVRFRWEYQPGSDLFVVSRTAATRRSTAFRRCGIEDWW
jgi:hypothetical protein